MRIGRTPAVLAALGALLATVVGQADWSVAARQDPARVEGLGPAGVEVLAELTKRPVFSAAQWATFLAVGSLLVVAGLAVSRGRVGSSPGMLMVVGGLVYLFGGLRRSGDPLLFTAGALTTLMWVPVLIHAGATFPLGGFDRRSHRLFVIFSYVFFASSAMIEWSIFDPRLHVPAGLSTSVNVVLIRDEPQLLRDLVPWLGATFLAIGVGLLALMRAKWRRGSRLYRRAITPLWLAGLVVICTQMGGTIWMSGATSRPPPVFYTLRYWPTAFVGIALFVGLMRYRSARLGVSRLMIDIGAAPLSGALAPALQRAVSDSTLTLLIWSPARGGYVTDDGGLVDLTKLDDRRAATYLDRAGQPVGVILHDRTLTDQPELLAAIRGATTLALDNQRLQHQLEAQLLEVRQSRERLVTVAEAERRRLERDVHDGAQQQLVAAAMTLQRALRAPTPERVHGLMLDSAAQLESAIDELREFARGLVPPLLRDRGLGAALRSLAERARIPVDLSDHGPSRWSDPIEACAFYVASEAVTNASKHAGATHVVITLSEQHGWCEMSVVDDGVGGARIAPDGGLAGLVDRAAALGGSLQITSPVGEGTRLQLILPAAEPFKDQS